MVPLGTPVTFRSVTILIVLALIAIARGADAQSRTHASPDTLGRPVPAAAMQARRVERADMTFNTTPMRDGTIAIDAHGGELVLRKHIRPNGSYTLVLQTPRDRVTVAFEEHAITVTRDKKSAVLALGRASDEDFDRVHRMLADSRATRLMRVAAANVLESEDDSPEAASLLMADAVVGLLTGDGAAPRRVARHLTRRVRASTRPAGMQVDCYAVWERKVMLAFSDAAGCEDSFSVWNPTRYLCAMRWLFQAESYWFSFLSCSGFPRV